MNTEQFIEFMEIVRQSLILNRTWRLGQAIWNKGAELYPEMFEQHRGAELDPFYSNDRIDPLFVSILSTESLIVWRNSNVYQRIKKTEDTITTQNFIPN